MVTCNLQLVYYQLQLITVYLCLINCKIHLAAFNLQTETFNRNFVTSNW